KSLGGLEIDSCYVCEGIWFDAGELEAVLRKDSPHLDYIRVGKEEFDGAEAARSNFDQSMGRCPRCPDVTYLARRPYAQMESVHVDICPRGHGVWLDGGEILKLGGLSPSGAGEKAAHYLQ